MHQGRPRRRPKFRYIKKHLLRDALRYLGGVGGQVDVSPLQVGCAVDLAPLLTGREGFEHGLGEGQGAVGHADPAELADHVPRSCLVP